MQVDKETLIKNRFWVLFGVFVPLAFFAVIWLQTAVEGAVEEERQKIKKHREELAKNANDAKLAGHKELTLCKEKIEKLSKRKQTVWKEAWDYQQGLMFWPAKVTDSPIPQKVGEPVRLADLGFGKEVPENIRAAYADSYMAQYEAMAKFFQVQVPEKDPKSGAVKQKPISPVAFRENWQAVLKPVPKWRVLPPSNEEVWLGQEDVWVRHELLVALREANASVARFQVVGKEPAAAGPPFTQTFENPYWRIDLNLYSKDQQFYIKGKITNIGKRRLALGRALFWLQIHPDEKGRIVLPIEGEARAAGESWDIKETLVDVLLNPTGLFGMEQILESQTAPVRRIDEVELFRHSHRTYEPLLDSARQFPKPKLSSGKSVGGVQIQSGFQRPLTPNGIEQLRYTDVTDQVRRMPLALVVIADQAHVPEVLTALANSKLRMQITQVNWLHFRGSLKTDEEKTPAAKDAPPKIPAGLPPPKDAKVAEEAQNNLVELSIYGIASLYERPPDTSEADPGKAPPPELPKRKK